jgi:hypothetical protein
MKKMLAGFVFFSLPVHHLLNRHRLTGNKSRNNEFTVNGLATYLFGN